MTTLLETLKQANADFDEIRAAGALAFDSEEEFHEFLARQHRVIYSLEESIAYMDEESCSKIDQ